MIIYFADFPFRLRLTEREKLKAGGLVAFCALATKRASAPGAGKRVPAGAPSPGDAPGYPPPCTPSHTASCLGGNVLHPPLPWPARKSPLPCLPRCALSLIQGIRALPYPGTPPCRAPPHFFFFFSSCAPLTPAPLHTPRAQTAASPQPAVLIFF